MKRILFAVIAIVAFCSGVHAFSQNANPPIYTEVIPTSSGLSYDPARDARETFRAPNGETVEALVKGPIGEGTYTRPMRADETPDTYFPAVLAEAVAAGDHHLVIPHGVYAFRGPELCTDLQSAACNLSTSCSVNQYWNCSPHWTIGQYPQEPVKTPDSVTDLDIDFSGSELDFSAPVIGLWILETQRLRLRNVTIDWPDLPIASLGTIVADPDNPGHNALVLDEKYPVTDRYHSGPVQIQAVDIWDESKSNQPGTFDPKANNSFEVYFIFGGAPQPTYVGRTSAGSKTFSCKSCSFQNISANQGSTCSFFYGCANFDIFSPGTRVIVRHYTYNGFAMLVNWSNDVTFDNVKLRTGPGIGISVANNGGYRGFQLVNSEVLRGPGRIIATASDAVDISQKADIIVKGNDIGFQGDDSLSIYPTTTTVTGVSGTDVQVAGICDPDPMDSPVKGDFLAFYDTNYVYKGRARVVAQSGSACASTLSVTLDHAIVGLATNDNILDLTQQASARFVVRDNVMHQCRCHGVLVDGVYGSIDHNLMYGNTQGPIQTAGGNGFGPGPTNLAIRANEMALSGQSTSYTGAVFMDAQDSNGNFLASPSFQKIAIEDNLIADVPGPAIVAASTRYFTLARNSIIDSNQASSPWSLIPDLPATDSILIYRSSYGTVCGNELPGSTTGPSGTDSTDKSVLVDSYCGRGADSVE